MENEIVQPTFAKLTKDQIISIINKGGILYRVSAVYSYYVLEYNNLKYYNFHKSSLRGLLNSGTIKATFKK
jgi:hypothetical protein